MNNNAFKPNVISFSSIAKKQKLDNNSNSQISTKEKLMNAKNIAKNDLQDINKKFENFIESLLDNSTAECIQYATSIREYHNMLINSTAALIDQNKELQNWFGTNEYDEIRIDFYKALIQIIEEKNNTKGE